MTISLMNLATNKKKVNQLCLGHLSMREIIWGN